MPLWGSTSTGRASLYYFNFRLYFSGITWPSLQNPRPKHPRGEPCPATPGAQPGPPPGSPGGSSRGPSPPVWTPGPARGRRCTIHTGSSRGCPAPVRSSRRRDGATPAPLSRTWSRPQNPPRTPGGQSPHPPAEAPAAMSHVQDPPGPAAPHLPQRYSCCCMARSGTTLNHRTSGGGGAPECQVGSARPVPARP